MAATALPAMLTVRISDFPSVLLPIQSLLWSLEDSVSPERYFKRGEFQLCVIAPQCTALQISGNSKRTETE
jgi:hypothetical protein